MDSSIFVVLGAKGGTGAEIVKRLSEKSHKAVSEIRCLVRNPSKVPKDLFPADNRIKLIQGDVTKIGTLLEPFKNATAVIFAAQGAFGGYKQVCSVDRDGVKIVADAAKETGVDRVVLLSSMLTHPRNRFVLTRILLNTVITGLFHKKGMMDIKFEGENLLRNSGQAYTIVRPGHLYDGDHRTSEIGTGQNDRWILKGRKSTRADVADFLIAAAVNRKAKNATIEIASKKNYKSGTAPEISDTLFDELKPDNLR